MDAFEHLSLSNPIECLADVSERTWALLGSAELCDGSCFIVDITDGTARIEGLFDGATGDVFACDDATAEEVLITHSTGEIPPAVHVIGSLEGDTGQVTVRQEQGNYLRICRWDRMDPSISSLNGAILRTLPQCGCGGSLGAPKLFRSFAEMCAYNFCAFYWQAR